MKLLTRLFPMVPFDPPENIRDVFKGIKKEHLEEKC